MTKPQTYDDCLLATSWQVHKRLIDGAVMERRRHTPDISPWELFVFSDSTTTGSLNTDVFEFREIRTITAGWAFRAVRLGHKLRRSEWPANQFLCRNSTGDWLLVQLGETRRLYEFPEEDLCADDWQMYRNTNTKVG